ncbi:MAG: cyclopropane fatty acyl phospholipid synthase [Parcubacteria group bacterium]
MKISSKNITTAFLQKADIEVNGNRDWDIQIHNPKFYTRVLKSGTMGLGEAHMEKWWDCERLDLFFEKLLRANTTELPNWQLFLTKLRARLFNAQSLKNAKKVAKNHYDLGNDLYMSFLDPYNQYTCGYFRDTSDLNEAQEKKLDLICRKLQLKKDDKVLDIGCGWGGFAKYAAEHYGCQVTGISISDEQIAYAKEFTKGLPVIIQKQDYREMTGQFDKIVSIGMIEHVGYKNYKAFMKKVASLLKDDGLFLLQTIGRNNSVTMANPWIDKYIFPGGMIPSLKQIGSAAENLLMIEDLHNFGLYYYKTLLAWEENFRKNYSSLPSKKYDEKFYRMWRYYLLSCAGGFKSRHMHLWQFVFSKGKLKDMYISIR